MVCRWQELKTPRTFGLRWEKFWGISKHCRALPVRVRPGLDLLHQRLLPSLAPSLSHSASHSSSLVSPGRVSLTNHIPQMFGSRSASERIQLKAASNKNTGQLWAALCVNSVVCITTSQSSADNCPVHLPPCSQVHSLLHSVLLCNAPSRADSDKLHIPHFCAYRFPGGFTGYKTLSRAQDQDKERRQVILLPILSFRLCFWQQLCLLYAILAR